MRAIILFIILVLAVIAKNSSGSYELGYYILIAYALIDSAFGLKEDFFDKIKRKST